MDVSRRQPIAAMGRGSGQAPGGNQGTTSNTSTSKVTVFQVGDVVRLTIDIPGSDFKAGEIVIIEKRDEIPMKRSPAKEGKVRGPYEQPKPDPAIFRYGFERKIALPVATWYRSRTSGENGAPHHSNLSLTPNGPPVGQRINVGDKVFLKNNVEVFAGPDHRRAHHLTAPIGTRCFIVNSVTHRDANAPYARGRQATVPVNWHYYIVQVKVLHYDWAYIVCPMSAWYTAFEKLSKAETDRFTARPLRAPEVVSIQENDMLELPKGFGGQA